MTENAKMRQKCLLRNGTESKNTSSYILSDHFIAFGLSRNNFFCSKQRGRGGGGGDFKTLSPFGPPGQLDWTKLAHCKIKTRIRPLRHILRKLFFLTKSPCGATGGPNWTKIAHAELDGGANKM